MKVVYVYRWMDGRRVLRQEPGTGEPMPDVYQALGLHWLPGFITELERWESNVGHPEGKEWRVVFRIDYQTNAHSQPIGRLLIYPTVYGCCVPSIRLTRHTRRITVTQLGRRLSRFLKIMT